MQRRSNTHNIIAIFIFAVAFSMVAARGTCQFTLQRDIAKSDLVEKSQTAEIDWGNECLYATGESVLQSLDEESNRSRAQLKAKGSAKTKAIANLMMAIEVTPISFKAVGKDYINKDPQLQQIIEDKMANAELVEEKLRAEGADTIVVVTVRVPMYGSSGIGSAILRSKFQNEAKHELPPTGLIVEKHADAKDTSISVDTKSPITSLILDCSGLGLQKTMNPKIRKADGTKIWGTPPNGFDFLNERGIVTYVQSLNEAKHNAKAGSNPLIIRAAGRSGVRFMCDPLVTDQDADLIVKEDQSAKFMYKSCVIMVVDAN